jgi:hypothetical protein
MGCFRWENLGLKTPLSHCFPKNKYHFFVYISLPKSRMCGCEQLRLLVLGNNNNNIDDKIHSLIENYRAYTRKLENTNFGEQGVIGLIFWYDEHDWIGQIVRIWTSLGGKSFHFIPMIKQQKKMQILHQERYHTIRQPMFLFWKWIMFLWFLSGNLSKMLLPKCAFANT